MSYLVEKGRFKRVYTNRNDVAQKVGRTPRGCVD